MTHTDNTGADAMTAPLPPSPEWPDLGYDTDQYDPDTHRKESGCEAAAGGY